MSPVLETRILFVGDMHLGRLPGGVPSELTATPLGPASALAQVVAVAEEKQVHAVAFAGDLVDGGNALFEAFGPLEAAVRQLVNRGIEVVAVAGNHDTVVLPRLANIIGSGFHLLGTGGTWSSHLVIGEAPLPVRLAGWSFPTPHFSHSPLSQDPPHPQPGEITLGLLHGDLDATQSVYAPVSAAQLKSCGYQGWLLGHVHRPDPVTSTGAPFYLGSLTPLDPSETGLHGPVLVTVKADASLAAERLPLAPLRWEHLEVSCAEVVHPDENLRPLLLKSMVDQLAEIQPDAAALTALGFRVRLTGKVARPSAFHALADTLENENLLVQNPSVALFLEKLSCEVTGVHDLDRMAQHSDPVGLLARRILALDNTSDSPDPPAAALLDEAGHLTQELGRKADYSLLSSAALTLESGELRRMLVRVAYRILDSLVEETGVSDGTD